MIFYGEPNLLVTERKLYAATNTLKTKPLFRFSKDGIYETDDLDLIERLKKHYKFENTQTKRGKVK